MMRLECRKDSGGVSYSSSGQGVILGCVEGLWWKNTMEVPPGGNFKKLIVK